MIVFASLQNLCHYKSLMPSKSMPQKSNHDFMRKYPYVRVGRLETMRIKDIFTKTAVAIGQCFRIRVRNMMTYSLTKR